MRLTIRHETHYAYETPPTSVIDVLRLTPCNFASQSVRDWRIEVTGDASLHRFEDAFGNVNHTFTMDGPNETLAVTATGTVETEPSNGVIEGTREPLPTALYLRRTALTEPTDEIAAFAREAAAASDGSVLDTAHKLNRAIHEAIAFDRDATTMATSADDAFQARRGVCQDLTHLLLAAARALGIPARYVSGYQFLEGRTRDEHAGHAWAELNIEGLGWVAFDPTAGQSSDEAYVRVAVGLDTMGASPVRGAVFGGAGEKLTVMVTMDQTGWQRQRMGTMSQSQTMQ